MKKIVYILLSVIMIVSIVSCGETGKEIDKETEKNENDRIDVTMVTAKRDPVGTILLCKSGEGGIASGVTFHSAGEYGISTPGIDHSFSELEGAQKVFGEEKTVLKYKNSEVCLKNDDSEEFGSFYCITDEYSSDDRKLRIRCLHGTDVIANYFKKLDHVTRNDRNASLTDEDMQKIAWNFLKTLYSKEFLDNYSFERVERDDQLNTVFVFYGRYVEGYRTDESIMLMITGAGTPFSVNVSNMGKYNYTDPVTKKDLDAAKEILVEKVASLNRPGLPHSEKAMMLTTDTSGKVYLEMRFTFTVGEEGEKSMESLYVNVN